MEFSARSSRLGNSQAAQGATRKDTPKTPPTLPGETRGRECASRRPWSRTFGGAASIGSQRCLTLVFRRGDRVRLLLHSAPRLPLPSTLQLITAKASRNPALFPGGVSCLGPVLTIPSVSHTGRTPTEDSAARLRVARSRALRWRSLADGQRPIPLTLRPPVSGQHRRSEELLFSGSDEIRPGALEGVPWRRSSSGAGGSGG